MALLCRVDCSFISQTRAHITNKAQTEEQRSWQPATAAAMRDGQRKRDKMQQAHDRLNKARGSEGITTDLHPWSRQSASHQTAPSPIAVSLRIMRMIAFLSRYLITSVQQRFCTAANMATVAL
eukprot:scpid21701/ scgid7212/ 